MRDVLPAERFQARLVAPSILSADFARLGEEVDRVLDAGVSLIHVDVMDGHFVPNITVGPVVLRWLAPRIHARGAAVDVHLMIQEPDRYLEAFAEAGADALSVHAEVCPHLYRTLAAIKELGCAAGVALDPATDPTIVAEALKYVDYLLVMTVEPGFGGQEFIPETLDKVSRLRGMLPSRAALEVDGGVGRETIRALRDRGANWFVAGSAIFGSDDPAGEARILQELADS